jgi:predicted DNA-binding transcriptional regulator YafY
MPRKPGPLALTRTDVSALIIELLERAGEAGMTKQELLAEIGSDRTSLQTIQRALDELREGDAQLTCSGADRRWRLLAPFAMPLEAPSPEDVLAVHMAKAHIDQLGDPILSEHMTKIVEVVDERVRERTPGSSLPARKTMTSSLTLSTILDPAIFREVVGACRRKPLRIQHVSPWRSPTEHVEWQTIEPWGLHMFDGAVYLRAWSHNRHEPRTFRLADVEQVALLDEAAEHDITRQPIPADIFGDDNPAYGIDHDRPDIAVIRMRGGVARWAARVRWHHEQNDLWIGTGKELLERRFAYRSCRELARRLAMVIDGIVSIEPPELREEVLGLWRRCPMLAG